MSYIGTSAGGKRTYAPRNLVSAAALAKTRIPIKPRSTDVQIVDGSMVVPLRLRRSDPERDLILRKGAEALEKRQSGAFLEAQEALTRYDALLRTP